MSPEVIKGEKYGQKADIWAIGCTLYEMVMLRRPFQCDSSEQVTTLFELIKNSEPPSVRDSVGSDLRMLISLLLMKDPSKRPSVWELVQMPCIKKKIQKFYDE